MSDTLTEDVLPVAKDDAQSSDGKETSQAPVSRAEFEGLQRGILDLTKKIDQGLASNRQSAADVIKSEVSRAQKDQRDFLVERLAGLLPKDGPSLESIKRDAWLDEQVAKGSAPPEKKDESGDSSASHGSGASLMKQEIQAILDETKLVGDEPELREYVRANAGKRWFEVGPGFYDLALKIAARNQGSPGGIVPGAGARLPPSDLKGKYLNDIATMRANGSFGLQRLSDLKAHYRQQGLTDVDSIDITSAGDMSRAMMKAAREREQNIASALGSLKHP
jgi:hypothetical protein